MSATPGAFASKDNAGSTLASGITSSTLSIPLHAGDGALFPQPYHGTCSSGGTATTLNCTGISATIGGSAAIGKFILNKTDGSVAVITAVATDSLTTSSLLGGTTNLWNNSDAWRIDEFVLTLVKASAATTYEEVSVYGRSTDTLNVASTGERGYNGTTAQSFSTSDNAYLFVTAPIVERFKDVVSVIAQKLSTVAASQTTDETNITNLQTGGYYYVVTTGSANAYVAASPALAALAAGNIVFFKANFTNSGSATLAVNGLTAKTIKKNDGATNLAANDIISGQIVVVQYDGTNFQMLSPVGTPATITHYAKIVYLSGASSTTLTNPTVDTAFDTHNYTIPANDLVSAVGYEFELGFTTNIAAGALQLGIMLGSTLIGSVSLAGTPNDIYVRGFITGTAGAGASVAVRIAINGMTDATPGVGRGKYTTANVATSGTLVLAPSAKFDTTNGGNTAICTMASFTKISSSAFA